MKWLKLWRTFKEGFTNFYRNGWLTFATVSVIALSVFVIGITTLIGFAGQAVITSVRENVNISVYFKTDTTEQRILQIKEDLEKYKEIKSVQYVSRDTALKDFMAVEGDNKTIQDALNEIGENPLPASLVLTAHDPSQYETIDASLRNSALKDEISDINYAKNKTKIDNLENIIRFTQRIGFVLGAIFLFIAVLITYNTIRITLYSHRTEFEIMRLVGASNLYIRMPIVFEGMFYGIAAAFGAMIMLAISVKFLGPILQGALVFSADRVSAIFVGHFWMLLGTLLLSAVGLGVISSFIAIRRYLKI